MRQTTLLESSQFPWEFSLSFAMMLLIIHNSGISIRCQYTWNSFMRGNGIKACKFIIHLKSWRCGKSRCVWHTHISDRTYWENFYSWWNLFSIIEFETLTPREMGVKLRSGVVQWDWQKRVMLEKGSRRHFFIIIMWTKCERVCSCHTHIYTHAKFMMLKAKRSEMREKIWVNGGEKTKGGKKSWRLTSSI